MTEESLKFINDKLTEIGIDYQFAEWNTDPVPNPYFVGEFTEPESPTMEENGSQNTTFMLTGTGTTWLTLISAKEIIEKSLPWKLILPNGNGLAVFCSGSLTIPTGDAELKRLQINLSITEWRVDIK